MASSLLDRRNPKNLESFSKENQEDTLEASQSFLFLKKLVKEVSCQTDEEPESAKFSENKVVFIIDKVRNISVNTQDFSKSMDEITKFNYVSSTYKKNFKSMKEQEIKSIEEKWK